MKDQSQGRPLGTWLLIGLLIFLSLGALGGGIMLVLDPSGKSMNWSTSMLGNSIFPNFLVPGLFLFVVFGVLPLFVAYALWRKPAWAWLEWLNMLDHKYWAWTVSCVLGITLIAWIAIQMWVVGLIAWLQPFMAAIGLVLLIVALLPAVRRYYAEA